MSIVFLVIASYLLIIMMEMVGIMSVWKQTFINLIFVLVLLTANDTYHNQGNIGTKLNRFIKYEMLLLGKKSN